MHVNFQAEKLKRMHEELAGFDRTKEGIPIPDFLGKCKMVGERRHSVAFVCILLVVISSLCIDASGSALFQPQKNKGRTYFDLQPEIPKSSREAGTRYEQEKRKVHTGPNPLHNR